MFENNLVCVSLENGGFINSIGYYPESNQKIKDDKINYINMEEVKLAYEYVSKNFEKSEKLNKLISSYKLKHLVEKAIGTYISNGALILAMSLAGFKFDDSLSSSSEIINVYFKVKERLSNYNMINLFFNNDLNGR